MLVVYLLDLLHESLVCSEDGCGGAGIMLVFDLPEELVGGSEARTGVLRERETAY